MISYERLTQKNDSIWECKIKGCNAKQWMEDITGTPLSKWKEGDVLCTLCPFKKYINRLCLFEDMRERLEDDLR